MEQDHRTDAALMLAYRDGEAAAFEALYARWRGPLYRYFLRQCGHAGQAPSAMSAQRNRMAEEKIGTGHGERMYAPTWVCLTPGRWEMVCSSCG